MCLVLSAFLLYDFRKLDTAKPWRYFLSFQLCCPRLWSKWVNSAYSVRNLYRLLKKITTHSNSRKIFPRIIVVVSKEKSSNCVSLDPLWVSCLLHWSISCSYKLTSSGWVRNLSIKFNFFPFSYFSKMIPINPRSLHFHW